jgi:hypothetical protein
MILILSVFVTNIRFTQDCYERSKNGNYSRIDIFKYMLESYKKIPFTEIYLFIKLDNEFLLPGQFFYNNDINEYIYNIFSHLEKNKIHIVLDRYTSQDKWIPFFKELIIKHGENESVWFTQNDDHIYIDYNNDILLEGIKHLENDNSRHKSIYVSHWPEVIKLSGKHNNQELIGNYVKFNLSILDSIQIFNLQFLYDIFVDHIWRNDYIRIDSLFHEFIEPCNVSFKDPLSQVIFIPLREMVRHFDGYGHVSMEEGACPRLELPSNTFNYSKENLIKKMTPYHKSQWESGNNFIIPQNWLDINLSLHNITEYTI